jgi:hypothetical protein
MSFVIAMPDLVEGAAGDLAAIRSSLAAANAAAAGPTTGIAAAAQDEVSVAIASMFGDFGQRFQAVNAQAQAFHAEFVELMSGGATAYLGAEAANAAQVLSGGGFGSVGQSAGGAVTALQNGSAAAFVGGEIQTGAQAISNAIASTPVALGALQTGGVSALLADASAFGATVAGPYQTLFSNTAANLQAIGATFSANPFPFVHQIIDNQIGYAQTLGAQITAGIPNLPAELANLPANLQAAFQNLLTFNPVPYLQGFVNYTVGYAQTITTSLQTAGQDLVAGLQTLPSGLQPAFQDLFAGNFGGAYHALNEALVNAFLPGFTSMQIGTTTLAIVPDGPLGALNPILAIPGQIAQNFTNLLPAGSIAAQVSQNTTNLVSALTNVGTTIDLAQLLSPTVSFGIPLQLILDGLGGPANALSALNSTAVAFTGAVQTGNVAAATATLLDAPAVVTNAFLNGTTTIALPPAVINYSGLTIDSTLYLPLGGILTPLAFPQGIAELFGIEIPLTVSGGTPVGGLIPGLLSFGPQLAKDITPIA